MLEIKLSNLYKNVDIFYENLAAITRSRGGYRTGEDLAKDFKTLWEKGNPKIILSWLVKYFPDINSTTALSYSDDEAEIIIEMLKDPKNHSKIVEAAFESWGDFKSYWEESLESFGAELVDYDYSVSSSQTTYNKSCGLRWNEYQGAYNIYAGEVQDSFYSELDSSAHYAGAIVTVDDVLEKYSLRSDQKSVLASMLIEDYRKYFIGDIDDDANDEIDEADESDEEEYVQQLSSTGFDEEVEEVEIETSDLLIGISKHLRLSSMDGLVAGVIEYNAESFYDDNGEDAAYEVDYESLDSKIVEAYNEWFGEHDFPGIISLTATNIERPNEYNYRNDVLAINAVVTSDIIDSTNEKEFDAFMKKNYFSVSGFFNEMPENIEEYREKQISDPVRAYSAAINFIMEKNGFFETVEEFEINLVEELDSNNFLH